MVRKDKDYKIDLFGIIPTLTPFILITRWTIPQALNILCSKISKHEIQSANPLPPLGILRTNTTYLTTPLERDCTAISISALYTAAPNSLHLAPSPYMTTLRWRDLRRVRGVWRGGI
jgi:hypothetical protein